MTHRDRRVLLLGAAVVCVAVLALRILPWAVRGIAHKKETALSSHTALMHARALLESRVDIRDSLGRTLSALIALAPKFVEGSTAAEAQASLSSVVSLAATRHAIRVLRVDPLPDSSLGLFTRVGVRAELEGDINGVTRLLGALETGNPMVSLSALAIQAISTPSSLQTEQLRVEMSVNGFYFPRPPR
jgi:hypothetical protein